MTRPEFTHEDERRFFAKILTKPVKQVNYYHINQGAVLGNHFHKKTTEYFFLVSGLAKINIDGKSQHLEPLCVEVVRPMQVHTFKAIQPCVLLTFLSIPENGKGLDIHDKCNNPKLQRR